ncbi:MAG: hypothetical protein MUE73_07685 [Planctomycetes bacterium]|jgi:hypothetical protein|nr:hypothetical protein [Planctomycetota bacterium]
MGTSTTGIGKEEADDGLPDPAVPAGNRARFHRTMSEAQFDGLHPAAWTSVKKVKAIDELFSARIGRYRALFRFVGEQAIVFERPIHRRDLEGTLRRMG